MNHMIDPRLLQEIIDGLTSGDIVIQRTEVEYLRYDDYTSFSASGARSYVAVPYGRRIMLELYDTRSPKQQVSQPKLGVPADIAAKALMDLAKAGAMPPFAGSGPIPNVTKTGIVDLGVLDTAWIGYRDFKTDLKDGLLQSRNGHIWPAFEPLIAVCTKHGITHDPPVEGCECGIYAYDTPDHGDLKAEGGIWGEVALYGDAFRCQSGYRAEMAYPQSLFMKDHGTKAVRRLKEHLEHTYGIPVFLVSERTGQTAADIITAAVASPDWPKSAAEIMDKIIEDDLW